MKFFEKYLNDSEKKKKFYMTFGIGGAITIIIAAFAIFLVSNFNFHVTSELGQTFDVYSVWKKDFKAPCTVAGTINTEEVGNYRCLVKVWGLIPMNVTVDVVDTTAPEVVLQASSVSYGKVCKPEDFISQVVDKSEVTHSFVTVPDTTKLGEQVIQIITTDKYNNSTTSEGVLTVKGVVSSYTLEGGSELPPVDVFLLDDMLEASYVTEVEKELLSTVGEHPIQIQVQGMTEDVTLVVVDTTAPTITTSTINVVVKTSLSYKKSIKVTDNCDAAADIELEVDNSEVNLNQVGKYVVHCTATDKSGNKTVKDVTVQVVEPIKEGFTLEELNGYADRILASIINDSMSLHDKAYAIYKWTRGSIGYLNDSPKGDWLQGAYDGMIKRRGDCFTYAATSKFLLERIGLEPLVITKEKASWTSQSNHYWLLLDLGEGYYHFDTTRRVDGTWFFMWTDAQMLEYSNNHGGSHNFSRDKYPKIQ